MGHNLNPGNVRRWPNAGLMLGRCQRRRPSIEPASGDNCVYVCCQNKVPPPNRYPMTTLKPSVYCGASYLPHDRHCVPSFSSFVALSDCDFFSPQGSRMGPSESRMLLFDDFVSQQTRHVKPMLI